MADFHKRTSQYRLTELEEFHLGQYVPIAIPSSINDAEFVITNDYHKRPELLANEVYGTPRLWWIFAEANKDILVDPIEDFTAGTKITVPTSDTIKRII